MRIPRAIRDAVDAHGLLDASRIPSATLGRAVAAGHVVRLLPSTYCLAAAEHDVMTQVRAVQRWRPDAVVTGCAAARLTYWAAAPVDRIDVATRSRCDAPHHRFHRITPDPEMIVVRDGIRMTSPAWTAVWLAAWDDGEALDAALRDGLSPTQMEDALTALRGHHGARTRAEIVAWSRLRPWSRFEREVHRLFASADITGWVGNWEWLSASGSRYVLDIAFPRSRVAVELDGFAFHGTREAWQRDLRRTNELQLDGWLVLHFTWADLADPQHLVDCVRAALAARGDRRYAA